MVFPDGRAQSRVDVPGVGGPVSAAHAERFRSGRHRLDSDGTGHAIRPNRYRTRADPTHRADRCSRRRRVHALGGAWRRRGGGGVVVRTKFRPALQRTGHVVVAPGSLRGVRHQWRGGRTGAPAAPSSPVQKTDGGRPSAVCGRLRAHGHGPGLPGIGRVGAHLGRGRARVDPYRDCGPVFPAAPAPPLDGP